MFGRATNAEETQVVLWKTQEACRSLGVQPCGRLLPRLLYMCALRMWCPSSSTCTGSRGASIRDMRNAMEAWPALGQWKSKNRKENTNVICFSEYSIQQPAYYNTTHNKIQDHIQGHRSSEMFCHLEAVNTSFKDTLHSSLRGSIRHPKHPTPLPLPYLHFVGAPLYKA